MSPERAVENNKYQFSQIRPVPLCGYIPIPPVLHGHMTIAWWEDRSLLSMVCVGSILGVVNVFLCEKGSKDPDIPA